MKFHRKSVRDTRGAHPASRFHARWVKAGTPMAGQVNTQHYFAIKVQALEVHCSRPDAAVATEALVVGVAAPYFALHCTVPRCRGAPWHDTCPPLPVIVGNCCNVAPISHVFSLPGVGRHRIPLISERFLCSFVPRPCRASLRSRRVPLISVFNHTGPWKIRRDKDAPAVTVSVSRANFAPLPASHGRFRGNY